MEHRGTSKLGMVLFSIYLVLYIGFVLLNAFYAESMELKPIAGVNLAILYGFGLIIAALILALTYGFFSKTDESTTDRSEDRP